MSGGTVPGPSIEDSISGTNPRASAILDVSSLPQGSDMGRNQQVADLHSRAIQHNYPDATQIAYLGSGEQGTTYKVTFADGTKLTAKVMPLAAHVAAPKDLVKAWSVQKCLKHPNLCKHIRGEAHWDCDVYIDYYEYAEGISLDRHLKEANTPLPAKTVIAILEQVAAALDHCLSPTKHPNFPEPIYHRDIKPSNLVVSTNPSGEISVKLIDFGVAKMGGRTITINPDAAGTLSYMAPEALCCNYTRQTDQYSLGIVAVECLLGSIPIELQSKFAEVPYTIPPDSNPPIPPKLRDIVNQLIASKPENRFTDYQALLNALRAITEDDLKDTTGFIAWQPNLSREISDATQEERVGRTIQRIPLNSCITDALRVEQTSALPQSVVNSLTTLGEKGQWGTLTAGDIRGLLLQSLAEHDATNDRITRVEAQNDSETTLSDLINEFGALPDLQQSQREISRLSSRYEDLHKHLPGLFGHKAPLAEIFNTLNYIKDRQHVAETLVQECEHQEQDQEKPATAFERKVASLIMNVLINRFLIPKISADLENLAKPPPPPVLTRPSEKLPEWVASLEGSTFLYGCISRSGHHDYIIDNYDKLAVSIFLRVQDSQGKLHGISRTLEIPIRYGPGRLVNKSLSVNLFGGEQYRLVFYDLEAMRLKLSNMFGSALPIRALTKLPESVTSPDQSQSIGQELSKQPGPNTPGEWIKACIAEQQQRDDDAWSEQQWINREFTVQSKLCPGRSFVIPMRILLKEILIEDETWIRTIEHTDEINVNPETGMVTIGIKTPSGVRQIEWARLDIIKDQVQALPATSYNPDTLKKKRGLAGLFHSISNFGVTNDWPPNTNELFKFVYHKPYWAVDPSTNRRIRAHEQLTTGCGYVDPASGYLQPDCREPLNIRLEPRVVVNQDSVEVVWMDRAARPRNLRERD